MQMAYLRRWWEAASDQSRARIKALHDKGQLEFILGGVVMSDEAAGKSFLELQREAEGFLDTTPLEYQLPTSLVSISCRRGIAFFWRSLVLSLGLVGKSIRSDRLEAPQHSLPGIVLTV